MPPMTKQPTRGRAGACLHVWLPGLVAGVWFQRGRGCSAMVEDKTKKVIKSVRACARMGHPTPMAFAMQSRHHFWYFRLPVWLSCEHVRYPALLTRALTKIIWGLQRISRELVRGAGGYMGVSPAGSTPVYSQISHLSTLFVIFCHF